MRGIIKQLLTAVMATSLLMMAATNPLVSANAQAISQAQIEQFKKLPRAQQEMLARQYGFDLSLLQGGSSNRGSNAAAQELPEIMEARDSADEKQQQTTPEDLEKQFDVSDKSLQPFGYQLFAGKPTTFAPVSYAPVPSNYTVGSGDTVSIQLYGKESQNYELTVDRQGRITIPELGPIQVAGLSFSDVQELIKSEVANRMIGMQAAVSMGELRSIQIYVMGEAYQPGTYTVSSLTTIMQALIVSGGVSDIASLRNIQLKRDGKTLTTLDLYNFLIKGDASGDRLLQQGDIVFIPPRGDMVRVYGGVLRPAIYELKNERSLTDVIRLAGGTKAGAYTDAIRVKRIDGSQRITQTVELDAANAIQLRNGDEVEINAVSSEMNQSIMLVGAVARPGYYEWREGIRVNQIIKNVSSGLLSSADLGYGIVVRERNLRRDIDVYQFDVAGAVSGQPQDNLELKPRDQIVIFSRYENAADEKLQLSDWILNESEKERKERQELLREYRKKYYRELAGVEEEDDEIEEYALYSRNNLLEPILAKLRNQFSYNRELPIVSVTGEVRYPGIYPLARNASEMDLIAAAGGFKESAYLDRAEVTRSSIVDGQTQTSYVTVNLRESLAGTEQVQLKGRDSLHVFQIPEWQNTVEVTLKGEVRFPGTYTVRRGETLSALVERAGGFTDYAFPEGAIFTRDELKTLEKERMRVLAQQLQQEIATNTITGAENNTRSYDETRQLLTDLMNVEPVGRLIIDLPQIVAGEAVSGGGADRDAEGDG
ncbi:MAG: polysaccharide biosynthesis protein, partial [Idiomarina sp. 34-48-12]